MAHSKCTACPSLLCNMRVGWYRMLENSFWKCELGTIPSAKAVAFKLFSEEGDGAVKTWRCDSTIQSYEDLKVLILNDVGEILRETCNHAHPLNAFKWNIGVKVEMMNILDPDEWCTAYIETDVTPYHLSKQDESYLDVEFMYLKILIEQFSRNDKDKRWILKGMVHLDVHTQHIGNVHDPKLLFT